MKTTISALALIAGLGLAGGALAQDPPSGGMNAKGNAPLKHRHTVNDGAAKAGANSFTQNEARKHILHSGYTDVSPLTKGSDGVWRGTATKGGASVNVGLDFKGNVSESGPAATAAQAASTMKTTTSSSAGMAPAAETTATGAAMASSSKTMTHHHWRHHRWHHRHHRIMARCAHPGQNGVACSGIDRNQNGVSDKEDRALKAGSHP